jgi:hypothetical protein
MPTLRESSQDPYLMAHLLKILRQAQANLFQPPEQWRGIGNDERNAQF